MKVVYNTANRPYALALTVVDCKFNYLTYECHYYKLWVMFHSISAYQTYSEGSEYIIIRSV